MVNKKAIEIQRHLISEFKTRAQGLEASEIDEIIKSHVELSSEALRKRRERYIKMLMGYGLLYKLVSFDTKYIWYLFIEGELSH